MYIDKLGEFDLAHALTATANSQSDVDQLAKGSAMDGSQPWLVVRMGTLLDSAAEGSVLKIALTHDSDPAFGTTTDAMSITLTETTQLTAANKIIWMAQLPPKLKRYLRLVYTITVENFTSGTVDAFIVANVDVLQNSY